MHDDFELDGWTVRPARLILEREGKVVHVKPKTMEVLVALAGCAGEVLSRDQLLERVWQNKYVSDDVITQAIAELRRALGDDFRHPVFVETVPRRGYRLIQTVRHPGRDRPRELDDSHKAPAQQSSPGTAAAPVAAPWLFGRTALVSVVAIAVVFVGWISIRIGSDGNAASQLRLFQVARHLPGEARPTRDTEAYELYLKARQRFHPHSAAPEQMDDALSLARRAVARDPGFAEAYALIAEIHAFRGFWNQGPREEMLVEARNAAKAALEIKPHLSYPHAVSGLATAVLEWKWEEGYRQATRATELDPDDGRSLSLRAALSLTRGKSAEAVQLAYRAYELDPINPHALGILSWVLYQARHYDKAAEFMAKTLEADPDALFARNFRPLALAFAGRYDEALEAERARSGNRPTGAHALILALASRQTEARQHLAQLPPGEDAGTAWGYLGEQQILLDRLERLFERRMTSYLMWLRTAPAWDPVRHDPRFHEVLERVGLTE
ncbi:MAG TPA: winged helix-turn-helix domain-containing protein [Vicinamibacterales bacterium]|nr:winged helix-turn-helix domain-containing protein [Vicinamibacterales bacterium]